MGPVTPHVIMRVHTIVTERIGTIRTVPPFAGSISVALCHSDEVVVGGGYLIGAGGSPGEAGAQEVISSEQSESLLKPQPNGWAVAMENHARVNGGSSDFAAKAECLKLQ